MHNYGPSGINQLMGGYSNNLIKPHNVCNFHYFRYILASKIVSLFKIKQPDYWPDLLIWWLVVGGWFAVVDNKKYGKIPIRGTLSGRGIWEQPTEVLISTPLVYYSRNLRMGEEVEVVRMSPFYDGAMGIVNHYARLLALTDDAITANLVNSRIGHVFGASNEAVAKSIKTVFDQISRGEIAVVDGRVTANVDTEAFAQLAKPGDHVITGELLENQRTIYRDFCKDVGILTGNENKKERLTTVEVEVGEDESQRLISYWHSNINKSIDKVNKLFGLELEVYLDEGYNTGRSIDTEAVAIDGNARPGRDG